jgi:hypothetical protein
MAQGIYEFSHVLETLYIHTIRGVARNLHDTNV